MMEFCVEIKIKGMLVIQFAEYGIMKTLVNFTINFQTHELIWILHHCQMPLNVQEMVTVMLFPMKANLKNISYEK